jgi:hypothetical protein
MVPLSKYYLIFKVIKYKKRAVFVVTGSVNIVIVKFFYFSFLSLENFVYPHILNIYHCLSNKFPSALLFFIFWSICMIGILRIFPCLFKQGCCRLVVISIFTSKSILCSLVFCILLTLSNIQIIRRIS